MKICTKCKIEKDIMCFSKSSGNKDGLYHWCKECVRNHQILNKDRIRIQQAKWRKKNKKHVAEYTKNYDKLNKDKRTAQKRLRRINNPDFYKAQMLKRFHGITLLDYKKMLEEQNGLCAICGKEETRRDFRYNNLIDLAVDHDHKTGKVRGLLCSNCNKAIGVFQDNTELLQSAINYLNRNK